MNKAVIYQCLSKVLDKEASILEALDPDAPLSEYDLTSLNLIQFIVSIEEALGFEVRDSDLIYENFSTINKIFNTLSQDTYSASFIKKCLILDADNVLWKGISGEEEIIIDDEILRFQASLLDLYRRGVLLCLCSKNHEILIKESFSHPAMLLNGEHFAAFYANHTDKATNIAAIADELNLPYDCMIFADDSDYELGFIRLNLPEITTFKVNHTVPDTLTLLFSYFDTVQPTADLNRTQLYREQKEREKEKRRFTSVEDYNRSLETQVNCEIATSNQIPRLSELSVRTHQFNLSAVSYTEEELVKLIKDSSVSVISLSVKDKYGDMGIVGMAVLRKNTIEAFMLSCRVFDRDLEKILLKKVKEIALSPLYGIYRANGKNHRHQDFYFKNGVEIL